MAAKILIGGKVSLAVRLRNVTTGDPYDISGATAITACFMKADDTDLVLTLGGGITVISAILGKVLISLTAAQTALLRPVDLATLEMKVTIAAADPVVVQIPQAYSVLESAC